MNVLGGLAIVGLLLGTVLIGVASVLDAHKRSAEVPERARRFVPPDWFVPSSFIHRWAHRESAADSRTVVGEL